MTSRRCLAFTAALLLTSSLLLWSFEFPFLSTHNTVQFPEQIPPQHHDSNGQLLDTNQHDPLHPSNFLRGPPTLKYTDNLLPHHRYMTSWISAGWTNDVMTYCNLIYLALSSNRIPILPMFTPSHIGGDVPPIPFGDVFDVPRLARSLGKPILEWRDVKRYDIWAPGGGGLAGYSANVPGDVDDNERNRESEELGCWNIWQSVQYREDKPRDSAVPWHLNLDVSYTQLPESIKLYPQFEHDPHATFSSLAPYAFPSSTKAHLATNPHRTPSAIHNSTLDPRDQLVCFDYLYYTCAKEPYEYDYDWSPAWNTVMRYMRFVPKLEQLAELYVRRTMGIDDSVSSVDVPTPPYIAVHIRHGDFANWCGVVPVDECFATPESIARRVRQVQLELWEDHKMRVGHVIVTSDERDEEWWGVMTRPTSSSSSTGQPTGLGYLRVDHTHTVEQHGRWYPVLIDAVIQSSGVGFVGTDRSTMSILGRRRVQDWRAEENALYRSSSPSSSSSTESAKGSESGSGSGSDEEEQVVGMNAGWGRWGGGAVRTIKWGTVGADDE